jgi:hypothetical protein
MSAVQEKQSAVKKPKAKRSYHKFMNSLEYDLISGLIVQQYQKDGEVRFDKLLSIAIEDRIPGLIEENGNKRIYQLLVMMVRAFCFALPLPKTKKLSETKMSVLACDIMLSSYEDQLSLEDVILFFERARQEKYGKIKSLYHHQQVMNMLEQYRQARHEAYIKLKQEKENELKTLGPSGRTCEEPKIIGDLFSQASVIDLNKKMSG